MTWRCRELETDAERTEAAEDAVTWGYPRTVQPIEITHGYWFRMGRGIVWWYQQPQLVESPEVIAALGLKGATAVLAEMHLAVAPRLRGHWPVRSWLIVAGAVAEIVGVDALLIATMPEDCKTPEYLSRLGFGLTPTGVWFRRLGEWE